jgi:hypothetical protein
LSKPHITHINIRHISSIQDVILGLQKQGPALVSASIDSLVVFNTTYIIVNQNISQAVASHYYTNPDTIEQLDIIFANYYFKALNQYYSTQTLPPVWRNIGHCQNKPAFIKLLIAANAHINHDLPLALLDLSAKDSTHLQKDFFATDKLFRDSGKEIIASFEEANVVIQFIKQYLGFLYEKPIMAIIIHWRHKAWKNYEALQNKALLPKDLVKRSNQIANALMDIS